MFELYEKLEIILFGQIDTVNHMTNIDWLSTWCILLI